MSPYGCVMHRSVSFAHQHSSSLRLRHRKSLPSVNSALVVGLDMKLALALLLGEKIFREFREAFLKTFYSRSDADRCCTRRWWTRLRGFGQREPAENQSLLPSPRVGLQQVLPVLALRPRRDALPGIVKLRCNASHLRSTEGSDMLIRNWFLPIKKFFSPLLTMQMNELSFLFVRSRQWFICSDVTQLALLLFSAFQRICYRYAKCSRAKNQLRKLRWCAPTDDLVSFTLRRSIIAIRVESESLI